MRKKSLLALAVCAVVGPGVSANAAFADEAHGKGLSACHFSGLNDDPSEAFPFGGRVQSYGQLVRQGVKASFPSPGVACNPTRATGE
jgi:hypothetical protein